MEEVTLGAAVIVTFKNPKRRHVKRSARAGLVDRRPKAEDSNPWVELLSKRRGYEFSIKVMTRIIAMFHRHGSNQKMDMKVNLWQTRPWSSFSKGRTKIHMQQQRAGEEVRLTPFIKRGVLFVHKEENTTPELMTIRPLSDRTSRGT